MHNINFSHGGNIYEIKRKRQKDILDFSASINPLGIPLKIQETIYRSFDKIVHYPDPDAGDLVKAIARYWRIDKENILIGNGSAELIYLILQAYVPSAVCIPVPAFSEYERAAKCLKSKIRFMRLKEKEQFQLNASSCYPADMAFLCNPNNPTGNLVIDSRRDIDKLSAKLIVVDEAFMDFVSDEREESFIKIAQKSKKVIVLRTFTKFFALAGLRIGYLIAHKDTVRFLRRYQIPWSSNVCAQIAAKAMLEPSSYIAETKALIEKERSFLFNKIQEIPGLSPYPSQANFLLVKIYKKNVTSSILVERLINKGILVRDCANFRGLSNAFIRVAVRSRKENLKLIEALK